MTGVIFISDDLVFATNPKCTEGGGGGVGALTPIIKCSRTVHIKTQLF